VVQKPLIEKIIEESEIEISIESDSTPPARHEEMNATREEQCDQIVGEIMSSILNWEEIAQILKRDDSDRSSESTEVVAGIDTSLAAVQQYVESIINQIRA
jgi:phosphoribulokinase